MSSLSLTRFIVSRCRSLLQRLSSASISYSSICDSAESRRERSSVSGRMTRKVALKMATTSLLDRWGGSRKLSMTSRMAFLDRADDDCKRTSRVSRLTLYWMDAPTTKWATSRNARNWDSQFAVKSSATTSSDMLGGSRHSGRGYCAAMLA